ncbi:hypothetical protein GS429_15845 [Natronorubrum sp. JWXQ-INN-674]|uniref:Uncharacterized protein n=1 Tax=Natronorubrum halalkaliphilum TaxID=2691917 RepID=A0A6B0VNW1_9EURY|nr:hypothetical protein [Natronorubrum halalkaliphilum]MXV63501.1 hypothetical protein [Natronorubrum halalkaliphilum]
MHDAPEKTHDGAHHAAPGASGSGGTSPTTSPQSAAMDREYPIEVDEPLNGELKPRELACDDCGSAVQPHLRVELSSWAARVHYHCTSHGGEEHQAVQVLRAPDDERGVQHELDGLRRSRTHWRLDECKRDAVFRNAREIGGDDR